MRKHLLRPAVSLLGVALMMPIAAHATPYNLHVNFDGTAGTVPFSVGSWDDIQLETNYEVPVTCSLPGGVLYRGTNIDVGNTIGSIGAGTGDCTVTDLQFRATIQINGGAGLELKVASNPPAPNWGLEVETELTSLTITSLTSGCDFEVTFPPSANAPGLLLLPWFPGFIPGDARLTLGPTLGGSGVIDALPGVSTCGGEILDGDLIDIDPTTLFDIYTAGPVSYS
jgi:hypothetical protein